MIRVCSIVLGFLLLASPAEAQASKPLIKYGKWFLLAGAIGMNYLAVVAHNDAEDSFDALEAHCLGDRERCILGPNGTYLDPTSESLYQNSLHYDRVARSWLIAGEAALAGAGVLFVWELTRPKGRPENIPFEPEIRSMPGGTGLGLRLAF